MGRARDRADEAGRGELLLTLEHERAYQTMDAWRRDTEEAEDRGFWRGCLLAAAISTIPWAVIIWCLHHWKVL